MDRLKNRIEKLSAENMQGPIIVLMEGEEPSEDQQMEITRALNTGLKPLIIQIERASKCKSKTG